MKVAGFSILSPYPPIAGGAHRIFNINLGLSNECNVFHFSLMPSEYVYIKRTRLLQYLLHMGDGNTRKIPVGSRVTAINSNYRQYTFANPLLLIFERMVINRSMPEFVPFLLDGNSIRTARRAITDCDLVQVEGPLMFDWIQKNTFEKKPIVLWEDDVIRRLYRKRISENTSRILREKEYRAVTGADAIVVLSKEDQDTLCSEYGLERTKIHLVPHGVDVSRIRPPSKEEKADLKARFGLTGKTIVLFTGTSHFPNVKAAEAVQHIASKMSGDHVLFLIAGSVGEHVRKLTANNIRYTGYVNDIQPYFRLADIAINPVRPYSTFRSGVNSKIIEYLAHGLPTVTTSFGARGLSLEPDKHVIISNIEEFDEKIEILISSKELRERLSEEGRKVVEECYDRRAIAGKVLTIYRSVLA